MEHKFKVGDKVECIKSHWNQTTKGKTYTVVGVSGRAGRWTHVLRDDFNVVGGYASEDFELVQPNSTNNWIEWNGGECPVADGTKVEVKFRDVSTETDTTPELWNWTHVDEECPWDIIAYRVVEEAEKPVFTSLATTCEIEPLCQEPIEVPDEWAAGVFVQEDFYAKPIKSDGGSSEYYKISVKTSHGMVDVEVNDVIYAMVGGDFDLGNVLKAARRMYLDSKGCGKEGVDIAYDVNKSKWFLDDFQMRFGKD